MAVRNSCYKNECVSATAGFYGNVGGLMAYRFYSYMVWFIRELE